MTDVRLWQRVTQQRARAAIRDWQQANRVKLTKEVAEDLADRIASALVDAVQVGAKAAIPPQQEPAP